jgi:hypothetical protein
MAIKDTSLVIIILFGKREKKSPAVYVDFSYNQYSSKKHFSQKKTFFKYRIFFV